MENQIVYLCKDFKAFTMHIFDELKEIFCHIIYSYETRYSLGYQ